MIEAIVFDFDGTILDTETVWFDSYQEAAAAHGVELPFDVYANGIGTVDNGMNTYLLQKLGSQTAVEAFQQKAHSLHKEKAQTLQPREGVIDYLLQARRLGLRIGLATSSSLDWVQPFLKSHQLLDFFDSLSTSDDVENVKPDPALYRIAVKRLNVQPEHAVAFEDSVNGARAAVAAGLHCVIVPNPTTQHLQFDRYDLRLSSFTDQPLLNVLQLLAGI